MQGAVKKFPEFFDIDGMVHHEFVQSEQSDTCRRLRDAVRRKRRDKLQAGTVVSASR
jgi:hypothetical protein